MHILTIKKKLLQEDHNYDLNKAKERQHIVEGLMKAFPFSMKLLQPFGLQKINAMQKII